MSSFGYGAFSVCLLILFIGLYFGINFRLVLPLTLAGFFGVLGLDSSTPILLGIITPGLLVVVCYVGMFLQISPFQYYPIAFLVYLVTTFVIDEIITRKRMR